MVLADGTISCGFDKARQLGFVVWGHQRFRLPQRLWYVSLCAYLSNHTALTANKVNGWNITLMEEAINSCNVTETEIQNCAPFAPWSGAQIPPCMPIGQYPDEPVGLDGKSISALPGCNPLWTDNSTKPTCAAPAPTPSIDVSYAPNLTNWNYVSCPLLWQNNGMMLNAKSIRNWSTNMTVDVCLSQCAGYKYAMVE